MKTHLPQMTKSVFVVLILTLFSLSHAYPQDSCTYNILSEESVPNCDGTFSYIIKFEGTNAQFTAIDPNANTISEDVCLGASGSENTDGQFVLNYNFGERIDVNISVVTPSTDSNCSNPINSEACGSAIFGSGIIGAGIDRTIQIFQSEDLCIIDLDDYTTGENGTWISNDGLAIDENNEVELPTYDDNGGILEIEGYSFTRTFTFQNGCTDEAILTFEFTDSPLVNRIFICDDSSIIYTGPVPDIKEDSEIIIVDDSNDQPTIAFPTRGSGKQSLGLFYTGQCPSEIEIFEYYYDNPVQGGSYSFCGNIGKIDLFELLDDPGKGTGTFYTEQTNAPIISDDNTVNFSNSAPGQYVYKYEGESEGFLCGISTTDIIINITENSGASPGSDTTLFVCLGETPTFDNLFNALGGEPDVGGTWTPIEFQGLGDYTYDVSNLNSSCEFPPATVTVIQDNNCQTDCYAGSDLSHTLYGNSISCLIDLDAYRDISAEDNGSWISLDGFFIDEDNIVDIPLHDGNGDPFDISAFKYEVSSDFCTDEAIITFFIDYTNYDVTVELCDPTPEEISEIIRNFEMGFDIEDPILNDIAFPTRSSSRIVTANDPPNCDVKSGNLEINYDFTVKGGCYEFNYNPGLLNLNEYLFDPGNGVGTWSTSQVTEPEISVDGIVDFTSSESGEYIYIYIGESAGDFCPIANTEVRIIYDVTLDVQPLVYTNYEICDGASIDLNNLHPVDLGLWVPKSYSGPGEYFYYLPKSLSGYPDSADCGFDIYIVNIIENPVLTYYVDNDRDGYGIENPLTNIQSCNNIEGYAPRAGDCDDLDPNINPDATEILDDGIDQNCDPTDDNPSLEYQGCSHGFWKNTDQWCDGYSQEMNFFAVFNITDFDSSLGKYANYTLQDALEARGGGHAKLMRDAVAAILNAGHPDIAYPYTIEHIFVDLKNAFLTSSKKAVNLIANKYGEANELGCPLSNSQSILHNKPKYGRNFRVTAFPNPIASGGFTLKVYKDLDGGSYKAVIYDLYGFKLANKSFVFKKGQTDFDWSLNTDNWPSGVYFLEVVEKEGKAYVKLLKE